MKNLIHKSILFFATLRSSKILHDLKEADKQQQKVFSFLMSFFNRSDVSSDYHIDSTTTYEEFKARVPVVTYEEFFPYIEKLLQGDAVVSPSHGVVQTFAKSSGTTNAKSKYIPLTQHNLKHNHYQAGRDMIAWAISKYKNPTLALGKMIGTTGSFSPDSLYPNAQIGDVSAHLFHSLPWYARLTRVAQNDIFLKEHWKEKLVHIALASKDKDVRILLGTPTWMMHILEEVLKQTNKKTIREVWPNISMFFHGAVRFEPYQNIFFDKIGKKMDCMNIYNASEGFIGFQYDTEKSNEFVLLTNHDIFYECILLSEFRQGQRNAIPLSQIKIGFDYVIVITTSGGLIRYIIGDTVRFTLKNPYLFVLTGRTKQCLNTFGEEVVAENIETALSIVSKELQIEITQCTVAPVVLPNGTGYHSWCIELVTPPQDMEHYTQLIDNTLRSLNSDYDAKRSNNLVLLTPGIKIVPPGTFLRWLESKGKLGGQHKVPLITENEIMIQEILTVQTQNGK